MRKFYLSIILVLGLAGLLIAATFTFPPVDTDDTLSADSDTLVPSQQAVKAYVDGAVMNAPATISVVGYGAVGDYTTFSVDNAAVSSGNNVLTCTTSRFAAGDVGKYICVHGAGAAGGYLKTTIASYTSGTEIVLTANAATTVTDATVDYGTNSTTAISDAITAANTNHCEVYFPNGTYLTTAAISPSCPIRGQSKGGSILKIDASTAISGSIVRLRSGSGLRDITIDGYVDANDAAAEKNVDGVSNYNTSATHISVENVNIQNTPFRGLVLAGSSKDALYWNVNRCYIFDCGYSCLYISNVSHCNFTQNIMASTGSHGAYFATVDGIKFVGNTVDKAVAPTYVYAGGAEVGFLLALDTAITNMIVDGNILQNNTTAGDGYDGIGLGANASMDNILICNNIIQNTGWMGIDMTSGMIMENNIVKNTKYSGIALEAWGVDTLKNSKVTNNIIDHVRAYEGESYGISLHGNYASGTNYFSNIQITGNKVIDSDATPATTIGLRIHGYFDSHTTTFSNIQILDNDLSSPTTSGYVGLSTPSLTEAQALQIVFDRNILPDAELTSSAANPSSMGYDVINESGTALDWLGYGYPGKKVRVRFSHASGCAIGFQKADGGSSGVYDSGDGNLYAVRDLTTLVAQNDSMDCYTHDGITWICTIDNSTGPYLLSKTVSGPLQSSQVYNSIISGTNEIYQVLPPAKAGMNAKFYSTDASTKTIIPNGSDRIIREGTAQGDGYSISLSSGAGNYVSLFSDSTDGWTTLESRGTLSQSITNESVGRTHCQNFENTGATGYDIDGGGWTSNVGATGTVNTKYTSTVLRWNQSCYLTNGASGTSVVFGNTAFSDAHCYGRFLVRPSGTQPSGDQAIYRLDDSGWIPCLEILIQNTGGSYKFGVSSTASRTGAVYGSSTYTNVASHTYTVWWEYQAGTGSNGVCSIWVAKDSTTKPEEAEATLTNSKMTTNAARELLYLDGINTAMIFDQVLLDLVTAIGSGDMP